MIKIRSYVSRGGVVGVVRGGIILRDGGFVGVEMEEKATLTGAKQLVVLFHSGTVAEVLQDASQGLPTFLKATVNIDGYDAI